MTLTRTTRWATALVAASVAALPVLVGTSPASAAVTHQYFTYTGGAQSFSVPTGVTTIFVQAIGGSGGPGGGSISDHTGGPGGAAGSISAALPVTPGEVLDVRVGNAGGAGGTLRAGGGSSGLRSSLGHTVSGGAGGQGDNSSIASGGGGGGLTAISAGGAVLLAAGGGGGGGGADGVGDGGAGGSGAATPGDGAGGTGTAGGPGGRAVLPGLELSGQVGQTNVGDFNGAGGGGGAGYVLAAPSPTGGGGGGQSVGATVGSGGGGGGGAGATSAVASAANVHIATAVQRGPGSLFISWDQPATTTFLSTTGEQFPGSSTTFLASITPATPVPGDPLATGTITFYDGALPLATVPVTRFTDRGAASFTTTTLAPGPHTISAAYSGDGIYAGSTSEAMTLRVDTNPTIASPASASAVVGQAFSFPIRSTAVPSAALTTTGSLDGLTFVDNRDGTATLAGRPAGAGTFPITVTADNGLGQPAVQRFTLTVALLPLSISTTTLPGAFTGQAYSTTLGSVGGTPPVTWTLASGKLPAGLTLNRTTSVLSGVPTTAGTSSFTVRATDSARPTHVTATRRLTLKVAGIVPAVYVANGANDSVTSYRLAGSGNVAPATRLTGTAQGLNAPSGLVLDANGRLYVSDGGSAAITEYDRGATTPTLTLSGPATGLAGPAGLTLDGSGRLVVADRTANAIRIFVPGVSGNTGPVVTLTGPDTGLASPAAVAVDLAGRVWVANSATNALTAYAPDATGDAKPVVTIAGPDTGLRSPQALTVDGTGHLLVANTFGASVTVYAPTASGDAVPLRTIAGSATGLGNPSGIDVDTAGRIYVADEFANTITSYSGTASGNVAPLTTIAGAGTGISGPGALAVTPPLSVLTDRLPAARVGHRYIAALTAGQGASPYRWTLDHGALPPGLRLSPSGLLSGVPTRTGRWAFTVRVTDAAHPAGTALQHLTLTVTR